MKQGPFPSPPVLLSARLERYYEPLRHPPGRTRLHGATAYTRPSLPGQQLPQARGRGGLPQFPHPPCDRSAPSTPEGSSPLHVQDLHRFRGLRRPRPARLPLVPRNRRAKLTGRQDSLHATDRTARTPPTGRLTLGSDAGRFPPTPPACYPAPWHLPGPDSHRQADASLCPDQILEGITSERWAHDGALPVVRPPRTRRRHDVCAAPGGCCSCRPAVGVKVERPTGRTTLTPARTGADSSHGEPCSQLSPPASPPARNDEPAPGARGAQPYLGPRTRTVRRQDDRSIPAGGCLRPLGL